MIKVILQYLQNCEKKFEPLYHIHEELIHTPEIININTDTISADQDHPIKLKLPYKTGDLGTDIMELLYIKKSGILFSIKNYNVTYFLNEENVIHSIYPNMFFPPVYTVNALPSCLAILQLNSMNVGVFFILEFVSSSA